MRIFATLAAVIALWMVGLTKSKANPWIAPDNGAASPVERVVVFGAETRLSLEAYARRKRLDARQLEKQHAGSGLVRCGNARGAGQLTLTDDIITSAAHVFFDERGEPRALRGVCEFVVEAGGEQIVTEIDTETLVVGSHIPYVAAPADDWAVARLRRPVRTAAPYAIGAPKRGANVQFVARGHVDWGGGHETSIEDCRLRDALDLGAEGTREFSFDCAAGIGASGGALLDASGSNLLAIYVGYHSPEPGARLAFSPTNYNFAVTVEGAFRRAVLEAAGLRTAAAE